MAEWKLQTLFFPALLFGFQTLPVVANQLASL